MDILYLVDRLEELINEGWHIPVTTNVVINEEEFLDIIDQMRISIPEEVKQAKRIQQEKDRLLSQAKDEHDRIIAVAREENQAILSDHEVLRAAEVQRQAIIEEGRRQVRSMRKEADAYVADTLTRLEGQLSGLLTTVRNGVAVVQRQSREQTSGDRGRDGDDEDDEPLPERDRASMPVMKDEFDD